MNYMKKITAILSAALLMTSIITTQASEQTEKTAQTVCIMNCDTGRAIGSEDGAELIYTADNDKFTLSGTDGKFIDITGESPKKTANPIYYRRVDVGSRAQIILPNGDALCDTGEGTGCYAVLRGIRDSNKIYSGWYITEASSQQPLKILPIGDSLTEGVNPDSSPWVSYRRQLSTALLNYFGRVCFVGNRAGETTLPDNSLLRHSGYGGYVIDNVYHLEATPGMAPLVDPMMAKYTPDIVLMMLGTNDCAYMTGTTDTRGEVEKLLGRWETFVLNIEAQLPENGIIICMSVPPVPDNASFSKRITYFNELMTGRITDLAEKGYKIGYVDTFSAVNENAGANISSDGVHLSSLGYAAEAMVIEGTLKQVYSAEGEKIGTALPSAQIPEEEPSVIEEEESSKPVPGNSEASPNTLIITVVCAAAVIVAACITVLIIVLHRNKKK